MIKSRSLQIPLLVATLLALVFALTTANAAPAEAASQTKAEQRVFERLNQARAARGIKVLQPNLQAQRVARGWSEAMAKSDKLSHNPNVASAISGPWQKLGENVGFTRLSGATPQQLADRLHDAFLNSPAHRSNMLGAFDSAGVGVTVDRTGTMWATVNFVAGPTSAFPLFRDTATSAHIRNVEKIWLERITTGCSTDKYCPERAVTRGEMATFLTRSLGLSTAGTKTFLDTPASYTHTPAIRAIANAGITQGCGSTQYYCPTRAVTRAEMATFLTRALPNLKPISGTRFSDVPASSTHAPAINAIAQAGITNGCGSSSYCPNRAVTRGEMASFLARALKL